MFYIQASGLKIGTWFRYRSGVKTSLSLFFELPNFGNLLCPILSDRIFKGFTYVVCVKMQQNVVKSKVWVLYIVPIFQQKDTKITTTTKLCVYFQKFSTHFFLSPSLGCYCSLSIVRFYWHIFWGDNPIRIVVAHRSPSFLLSKYHAGKRFLASRGHGY